MKVLFIGGTGNISTATSKLAIDKGAELWLLNRGQSSAPIPGTNLIQCDISNEPEAYDLLKEHVWDCVVNWVAFEPADIERDIRLFTGRTQQYIFISSASCYQTPLQHPIITEETPLDNPLWKYSQQKIACESRLFKEYREKEFPITIVRPSHTYGNVIPICIGGWTEYTAVDRIKKGLPIVVPGDGTSIWVLTHSEDFAKGFFPLLGMERSIGEAFHITSDELLTWNQIHEQLAEAIGIEAKIVHVTTDKICQLDYESIGSLKSDKSNSVIFDNSKIKQYVPGFQATIPFREGIQKALNWFDQDPSRQSISIQTQDLIEQLIKL